MARTASAAKLINTPEGVDQDVVLDSLRAFHVEQVRRDQGLILLAVQWARLNPGITAAEAAGSAGVIEELIDPEDELWEELAHKGCPHMEDLAIPAFADAAGLSAYQARKLIREALMLVFLLPRVWQATSAGQLEVFRARLLAEACWQLSPAAVAYVDEVMSASTARHTQGGRDGVIAEARLRYMPEAVAAEEEAAKEKRCFGTSTEFTGFTGIADVWGTLDLTDALDVESAVSAGAEKLKTLGSKAPLGVRRSWALGDLARASQQPSPMIAGADPPATGHPSADATPPVGGAGVFYPECACSTGILPPGVSAPRPYWDGKGAPAARVMMYLHLSPESLGEDTSKVAEWHTSAPAGTADAPPVRTVEGRVVPTSGERVPRGGVPTGEADRGAAAGVVRVEGNGVPPGMVLTAARVREWLARPAGEHGPKIIFRPVMDLADEHHVESYEIPDRLREHVGLRTGGCVFPYCHRKAHRSDCDHTIPWNPERRGGPTCTCNLAPLCRFHHRAKTHADNHHGNRYTWWRYESLGGGKYVWSGPGDTKLLRTNAGVYDISADHRSHGPRTPDQLPPSRSLADVLSLNGTDESSSRAPERKRTRDQARERERTRVQAAAAVVKKIHASIPFVYEKAPTPPISPTRAVPRTQFLKDRGRVARTSDEIPDAHAISIESPDGNLGAPTARSLAERIAALPTLEPSALEDAAADLSTEWTLFSTPAQRKAARVHREFYNHTGIYLPGYQPADEPLQIWTGDQLEQVQVMGANNPRGSKAHCGLYP